jgi:hypothetical protein
MPSSSISSIVTVDRRMIATSSGHDPRSRSHSMPL